MFRLNEVSDVIYNVHVPSERECINREVIERNEQYDYHFELESLFQRFQRGIGSSSNGSNRPVVSKWGQRSNRANNNSSDQPHSFFRNISSSRTTLTTPHSQQTSLINIATRNRTRNDKFIDQIKELVGENLYANSLKKAARLISARINVEYPSYARKNETMDWFRNNWKKIEPIYTEFIGQI